MAGPGLRPDRCDRGEPRDGLQSSTRGAKSGAPDGDRLGVLASLIGAYEADDYPTDPPDPIEAIKFRMEQQGLARKDLEPIIGTRTRVAEVLDR